MPLSARHPSPPHPLPRPAPRPLLPVVSQPAPTGRTPHRRALGPALASLLLGLGAFGGPFGCGRTEIPLPDDPVHQMGYEVEAERDIELDDENLVHVELVSPADPVARAGLMALEDGIPLEDVIAAVCPDGSPRIELDNTGEAPFFLVWMEQGLRAVIWL